MKAWIKDNWDSNLIAWSYFTIILVIALSTTAVQKSFDQHSRNESLRAQNYVANLDQRNSPIHSRAAKSLAPLVKVLRDSKAAQTTADRGPSSIH